MFVSFTVKAGPQSGTASLSEKKMASKDEDPGLPVFQGSGFREIRDYMSYGLNLGWGDL